MRLIDADALKTHYSWWEGGTKENTLDEQKEIFDTIVDLQPTIDPVKHGRWEKISNRYYKCSCCNAWWSVDRESIINEFKYCPDCGAQMERSDE